jgi:hypothetical protein
MPFPTVPIEQAIFNSWSLFITSIYPSEKVRRLRDNFIAPAGEYTAMKLVDIDPVSSHAAYKVAATDITGRGGSYSNYTGVMTFEVYGEYAMSRAQGIVAALREDLTKQVLRDNGIGFSSSTAVRDASRVINAESYEERAQFSVEFNFVQGADLDAAGDDPSIIERVTGEGHYSDDCGDTYDYTEDFEASIKSS